ncbi:MULTISPECIES: restriction endonuclease subunit S [Enterobacteriaceae]|uniref:restriction endonuclease subunit S n=1 Tax=Enterobacteriaceae TaxID=543 RepID=UPI00119F7159|nr:MULTISPECIES: restriction endonuclease subunit S [Enterobacteriaceae]MCR4458893.1 restriction endonuclease subunit S [Pseudescherichia sp. L3]
MAMEHYNSYKESGSPWLGQIPSHWSVKKLKFLAVVQPSNVDKKTIDGEEPVLLCNYTDVYKNEYIDSRLEFMPATATLMERRKFSTGVGDVIVTKDSEDPSDIAIPACVSEKIDGLLCGYHLTHIKPISLDGRYLLRLFQSKGFNAQFIVSANGVTRFGLPQSVISNAYTCVPPVSEQQRIAAFLDFKTTQIDSLIAKQESLLEKLAEKRMILINQAVTKGINPAVTLKNSNCEWLGSIPSHWTSKKIKYFATITRGRFSHRPRNDPRFYNGEYPFIQTGDVANADKFITSYVQTLNDDGLKVSRLFPSGTLVMTIAANIGDMAILDFDACFPDSIVGFIPKEDINLNYLYYLFIAMKQQLLSTAVLNTQLNLNIERIGDQIGSCPPKEEQDKISEYLDDVVAKIIEQSSMIKTIILKLQEYRAAIITNAVTGKIDLRNFKSSQSLSLTEI